MSKIWLVFFWEVYLKYVSNMTDMPSPHKSTSHSTEVTIESLLYRFASRATPWGKLELDPDVHFLVSEARREVIAAVLGGWGGGVSKLVSSEKRRKRKMMEDKNSDLSVTSLKSGSPKKLSRCETKVGNVGEMKKKRRRGVSPQKIFKHLEPPKKTPKTPKKRQKTPTNSKKNPKP